MGFRLALLGDSIAAGRGAEHRSETPGEQLPRRLLDEGVEVTARVFAVPGALSAQLAAQVERTLPWHPHVAVIMIGANDLIHHTRAGRAARNLGDAVRRLRGVGAEVVVAPAPDLSALPDVPPGLKQVLYAASMLLRDTQITAAIAAGAQVADRDHATSSVFAADRRLFCGDRFHPSGAGYNVIVDSLLPVVHAAISAHEPPAVRLRLVDGSAGVEV